MKHSPALENGPVARPVGAGRGGTHLRLSSATNKAVIRTEGEMKQKKYVSEVMTSWYVAPKSNDHLRMPVIGPHTQAF